MKFMHSISMIKARPLARRSRRSFAARRKLLSFIKHRSGQRNAPLTKMTPHVDIDGTVPCVYSEKGTREVKGKISGFN